MSTEIKLLAVVAILTACILAAVGCHSAAGDEPNRETTAAPSAWSQANALCTSRGIPAKFTAAVIYATAAETKGPAVRDTITADEREAIAKHFLTIMAKIERQTVANSQQKAMYEFLKLGRQREAVDKLNAELQAAEKAAAKPNPTP